MRILPGGAKTVSNESITSRMLLDYGVKNPDFIPTIFRIPELDSPLISLLDIKGLKTSGLNYGSSFLNSNYRTVASNHIQYKIESTDIRKEHFKAGPDGYTYQDEGTPTTPGLNKKPFYVWLDSNYIGYNDIFLLADGRTQLFVLSDGGEEESNNSYRYKVVVQGNLESEYVDPVVMSDGYEVMLAMTQHPQDFSDTGNERYTFGGFGDAYLSLQRIKYSYSGTAKAMDKNGQSSVYTVMHNGQTTFLEYAELEMLKIAARFTEFQILEGKTTVNFDSKKVMIHDDKGREIQGGSGVMYSNYGPIEMPMNNGWNKKFLESFFADIDPSITRGADGNRELALLMAPRASLSFQQMMTSMRLTLNQNIVGEGAEKGVVDTYKYYEMDGIKIIASRYEKFSHRPGVPLIDGSKSNEWDCVGIPIGLTAGGRNSIELVQLRPTVKGTVAGIDAGGNIANSVDGSSTHMLWQLGVISQVQPILLYRPYKGKNF